MTKYDKKVYNTNAGKKIGRDSLNTKEGTQQCNIPRKIVELAKKCAESEESEEVDIFISALLVRAGQRIPQPASNLPQKAKAIC